jgi:hypothetical protein
MPVTLAADRHSAVEIASENATQTFTRRVRHFRGECGLEVVSGLHFKGEITARAA